MTPLSRWKLSTEEEEKVKQVLVFELTKVAKEEEMKTLIKVLLTDTEQLMMAKRIFAFVLIDRGESDVEIAKMLHFTRATVNRLRVTYKNLDEKDLPVKKLVKEFDTSEILKDLLKKFLVYAATAAMGRIPR